MFLHIAKVNKIKQLWYATKHRQKSSKQNTKPLGVSITSVSNKLMQHRPRKRRDTKRYIDNLLYTIDCKRVFRQAEKTDRIGTEHLACPPHSKKTRKAKRGDQWA